MDCYVEEACQVIPGIPLWWGNGVPREGCEFMSLVTDPVNSPHTERAKVGGQTMQPSFTLVIGLVCVWEVN